MTTPYMHLDCDGFADALAPWLDGDAPESVRTALERHTVICAECRGLLADLEGIRRSAASLPPLVPSRDLWAGISERIDARVIPLAAPIAAGAPKRRPAWLKPGLAAAALVIVTAGITHVLTRAAFTDKPAAPSTVAAARPVVSQPVVVAAVPNAVIESTASEAPERLAPRSAAPRSSVRFVSAEPAMSAEEPVFTSEIAKLRRIVRDRRSQLDPATVVVLEQSIAVIDAAIAQSRAALLKDPASGFLASQLNHSLEKKVELLRTAASLPART